MNEDLTQVAVAALADTEEPGLAAGRVLSGHKSEPGRELTAFVEGCTVADCGDDCCCDQRAYTGDLPQPHTGGIGGSNLFHLRIDGCDLLLEFLSLAPKQADQVAHTGRQIRVSVLEDLGHRHLELARCLCEGHPTLKQEGSQLVDDRRSSRNQPVSHAVERLQIQLVIGLDRNEAHILTVDSFGNRLRIKEVVLIRLHKRLHELSGNQPGSVAKFGWPSENGLNTNGADHVRVQVASF